jgi:hypothetical protein
MFSQLSCCNSLSRVDLKHSPEKIFNIVSAVFGYFLGGIGNSLAIAEILGLPAKFLIPSAPVQMGVKLCIAKTVLKGNSILSIKKRSTPKDQISISQSKNRADD